MRAIEPRQSGFAINPHDGVRSYYEVFGPDNARSTLLFLPTWSLVHSHCWKMQVPYFARRGYRAVTFDGRGNGKSDRPESGYTADHYATDALAVCEAVGAEETALVALSAGARPAIQLASEHPARVSQLILIAPAIRLEGGARYDLDKFLNAPPDREGWNKYNAVHWREDYRDFVEWFVGQIFSEPHSTKPFDDFIGWAMETTPETLIATTVESAMPRAVECCRAIRCPTLLIHGDEDRVTPIDNTRNIQAEVPNSEIFIVEGGGHVPNARDPVRINFVIGEFLERQSSRQESREMVYASD